MSVGEEIEERYGSLDLWLLGGTFVGLAYLWFPNLLPPPSDGFLLGLTVIGGILALAFILVFTAAIGSEILELGKWILQKTSWGGPLVSKRRAAREESGELARKEACARKQARN